MPATLVEWIAVALAFAYVLLAIRQSRWCWPAAAASAGIYLVLFARGGLPMQAALQVFYIAMAAYGWRAWRAAHGEPAELRVRTWPRRWHVLAVTAVLLATVLNVRLLPGESGLFVIYVMLTIRGFVAWRADLARNTHAAGELQGIGRDGSR